MGIMNSPVKDLGELLRSMEPRLNPGVYAFVSVKDDSVLRSVEVFATVREPEGVSAVVLASDAVSLGLTIMFRASWITLTVHSDLQAIGLTAAFSSALGAAGISCNVIAGVHHDHIFVPVEQGLEAVSVLRDLQHGSPWLHIRKEQIVR